LAGAITPPAGLEALRRVLASGRRRVVVDTYDLLDVLSSARRAPSAAAADAGRPAALSAPAGGADGAAAIGDERARVPSANGTVAAASDAPAQLIAIWSELLGVDGIGVHDDFFKLGGHSLMATRMLSRIDEAFGVRLSLRDIFDAPTIDGLAVKVAALRGGSLAAAAKDAEDREEIEF
jgi:acyl carrier protein